MDPWSIYPPASSTTDADAEEALRWAAVTSSPTHQASATTGGGGISPFSMSPEDFKKDFSRTNPHFVPSSSSLHQLHHHSDHTTPTHTSNGATTPLSSYVGGGGGGGGGLSQPFAELHRSRSALNSHELSRELLRLQAQETSARAYDIELKHNEFWLDLTFELQLLRNKQPPPQRPGPSARRVITAADQQQQIRTTTTLPPPLHADATDALSSVVVDPMAVANSVWGRSHPASATPPKQHQQHPIYDSKPARKDGPPGAAHHHPQQQITQRNFAELPTPKKHGASNDSPVTLADPSVPDTPMAWLVTVRCHRLDEPRSLWLTTQQGAEIVGRVHRRPPTELLNNIGTPSECKALLGALEQCLSAEDVFVIIPGDRGIDCGVIIDIVNWGAFGAGGGGGSHKRTFASVLRVATTSDVTNRNALADRASAVLDAARSIFQDQPVTLVAARYQFDAEKFIIFFEAKDKTKLHTFGRELISEAQRRIRYTTGGNRPLRLWLHQIGYVHKPTRNHDDN